MPQIIQTLRSSVFAAVSALPQTGSKNLFTVTGENFVHVIFGRCTVAVGGVPNATKIQYIDTVTTTTTDLCATAEFNALAAGTLCLLITSAGTAMSIAQTAGFLVNPLATAAAMPIGFLLSDGTIRINCAGSDGGAGRVTWGISYIPMSAGANIAAV